MIDRSGFWSRLKALICIFSVKLLLLLLRFSEDLIFSLSKELLPNPSVCPNYSSFHMDNAAVLHLLVVLSLICYHRDIGFFLGTPKIETLPLHWRPSNSQKAETEYSLWA